mgnify:CR=1 FL=1
MYQKPTLIIRIALMVVMLFAAHVALAADIAGVLSGRILDAESRTPLKGAQVTIPDLNLAALTDDLGFFSFSEIKPGAYLVQVSYLGYEKASQQVEIGTGADNVLLFSLQPKIIAIPEVTISETHRSGRQLTSIQALDLQQRPMRSSQDALRSIPGLVIAQHAGGGKAEQIFLRGFDIDHGTDIYLSVDGMPVNMVSHAHGQGYADLHFLIPETIETIDWGKGPYDARYGDFTTAGYAGFRTKSAIDQSSITLESGQFGTLRAAGMIDLLGDNAKHHAYVATEYVFSNGYFDAPQAYNRLNVMAKYSGFVSENALLEASASTFSSQWDASGQIPDRAVMRGLIGRFGAIDPTEGGNTSRKNINLALTQSLGNGATLQNRFYYSYYDFELYSNFTFFLEEPELGDQIRQQESRDIYGWQSTYKHRYHAGGIQMQTEAGLGLRLDQIDEVGLAKTVNRSELIERLAYGDTRQGNASAYVSQRIWPSEWLMVEGALRYDYFRFDYQDRLTQAYDPQSADKGIVSPKLNFNFKVSDAVSLYLHSGTGFHSNDARVIVSESVEQMLPRAYGSDLGAIVKPVPGLLLQGALWGLWLDQEFVYVGGAGIVEPGGKTRGLGVDLSARYQFTPWLFADADFNYTYARATEAPEDEAYIPLAPRMTGVGGISVRRGKGLEGSLRFRYLGDRAANEDYSRTAEGYALFDAVVRYKQRKYEAGIFIENILNTEWKEAQFDTESRLADELEPVTEIHFTPGAPFFARLYVSFLF